MIKPTVGRIVLFKPSAKDVNEGMKEYNQTQPMAAIIAHVWDDRCVDLDVIDHTGLHWQRKSVLLLQDDDAAPSGTRYAEWMPYQKGQAAGADTNKAAHREAREIAVHSINANAYSMAEYLTRVDALARYIESGTLSDVK